MQNRTLRTYFAAIALLAALAFADASSAQTNAGSRDETERKLAQLRVEIDQLSRSLDTSRSEFAKENNALKKIDLSIQTTTRSLRELQAQQADRHADLARLFDEREKRLASLEVSNEMLAGQVRDAYRLGRQSRLKLLLNQDATTEVGRMMTYYEFLNRAQAERISSLRATLKELDDLQDDINGQLDQLARAEAHSEEELRKLNRQRTERTSIVSALSSRIGNDEDRLGELQRNREDLESLLERLEDALADIPVDLGSHLALRASKGKLAMPVKGRVLRAYGQGRGAGLTWHGWLIAANAGTEVRSVAYGRVAFADWLRGYGLLMIVDHGDGYMSLYGHNEGLLHDVGDWVQPGEPIALVGVSTGSDQGMYFELRKDGKALDPAAWLSRR